MENTLDPRWKSNYTALAMSCSDEYVPYLAVCLQSLKEHTDPKHNYDVLILERAITEENKRILTNLFTQKNLSLRFINPMPIISQYNLKFPAQYNLECYFRLTSPLLFPNYKKIIFTDVDIIFQRDIHDLFKTDVKGKPLAACQDLVYCGFLDTPGKNDRSYATEELGLTDPYKYFNTGVMVLNLDYWRKQQISEKLLKMANEKMYRILEQDVLNKFFKENIVYLDDVWNFPTMNWFYVKCMANTAQEYQDRYAAARLTAAIIHWAGGGKPWKNPSDDLAYKWWMVARRTPFYETILQRYFGGQIFALQLRTQKALRYPQLKWKYWYLRVLANVTAGKTREKFLKKKQAAKHEMEIGSFLWKKK